MYRLLRTLFAVSLAACLSLAAGAQTWSETVLYDFDFTHGGFSTAPLIHANDGNFYGVNYTGGANGNGEAFKLSASGAVTPLHAFLSSAEGAGPGGLVEGPDGNFYGATGDGGANGFGSIFKMTSSGTVTVIYPFTFSTGGVSTLVLGNDGNFWGSTGAGENGAVGTVFKVTPAGGFSIVVEFPSDGSYGYSPQNALVQASDGKFYGTALQTPPNEIILSKPQAGPTPSSSDGGLVFSVDTSGHFGIVYSFTANDGNDPDTTLVEGSDGRLYGETFYGVAGYGSIFATTLGGGFTDLYSFTGGTDNGSPEGDLYPGSDGNLYGTASSAGVTSGFGGGGTVFKLTTKGALSTLYTFGSNSGDIGNPDAGVQQGTDGNLYGTADTQGSYAGECNQFGCGGIYKLTASSPTLSAPVQLSLSASTAKPDAAVTLTWKVLNAYSDTLQVCYGYQSGGSGGGNTWAGKQTGKLSGGVYSGSVAITPTADGTYTYSLTCGGRESGSVSLTVSGQGKDDSTTKLAATPASLAVGQKVTLKATVSGSGSTPTGTITFATDGLTIGSVALSSGTASLSASSAGQPVGTYPVTASYSGDSNYNSSESPATNVTLTRDTTSTTMTATPTSITPPANVTLTATVKNTSSGVTGTPTGSVTFKADGEPLATVNLKSGVATLTASSSGQKAATYSVTATYNGDGADAASTSTGVNVTVK